MHFLAEIVGGLIIGIVEAIVGLLIRAARWLFMAVFRLVSKLYRVTTRPRAHAKG